MVTTALVLFGLALGSFINALVWRLHQQERAKNKKQRAKYSISKGRSVCPHCEHKLSVVDLIPVVSWLWLGGKCRYCKKPISWQYPAVETATALLFVGSYIFWPYEFDGQGTFNFVVWLIVLTGLVALIVYDLRWMLLPNRIIFPMGYIILISVFANGLVEISFDPITSAIAGAAVGGGLFYLLFQLTDGKWIGGGDVKLGFLLGAVTGAVDSAFLMLFLASLMGTLVSLPLLAAGKVKRDTRIPFGPFLITSTFIIQLLGNDLINWYLNLAAG
jgi:prepilin signal peptidase PulO-like enzyme (type II secretory pathway)